MSFAAPLSSFLTVLVRLFGSTMILGAGGGLGSGLADFGLTKSLSTLLLTSGVRRQSGEALRVWYALLS